MFNGVVVGTRGAETSDGEVVSPVTPVPFVTQ
jgi:hypothetical protein